MNRKQFIHAGLVTGGAALLGCGPISAQAESTVFSAEQIDEFVSAAHGDFRRTKKILLARLLCPPLVEGTGCGELLVSPTCDLVDHLTRVVLRRQHPNDESAKEMAVNTHIPPAEAAMVLQHVAVHAAVDLTVDKLEILNRSPERFALLLGVDRFPPERREGCAEPAQITEQVIANETLRLVAQCVVTYLTWRVAGFNDGALTVPDA